MVLHLLLMGWLHLVLNSSLTEARESLKLLLDLIYLGLVTNGDCLLLLLPLMRIGLVFQPLEKELELSVGVVDLALFVDLCTLVEAEMEAILLNYLTVELLLVQMGLLCLSNVVIYLFYQL